MSDIEVWDPSETPRRLTLFEEPDEGTPFVLAYCEPRFWEGFYVPVLSLQLIRFLWERNDTVDPNGTWNETRPRLGVEWECALHEPSQRRNANDVVVIPHHDGDPSLALVYEPVGKANGYLQYAFDRLPWRDA